MDYFIRIKAALDWIEGRLTEEIRPADVAEMACFSRSHFHTVFSAAVGMPLAAYIRKRRLCHAARDLLESGDSILDIAMRYGFASHEAFIRAFRRELGCVPSAFRKAGKVMDSGVIVPGIFGPMPPGPSSLRSCLLYMGVEVPYGRLLVASGAAFRLMWNTAMWDGGNVDILLFRKDPFEPLRLACRAAGRKMDLVCRGETTMGFSLGPAARRMPALAARKNSFPSSSSKSTRDVGKRSGTIRIEMTDDHAGFHYLTLSDNGVGLPLDFDAQKSKGMGFRIIDALSRQLGATFEVERGKGTKLSFRLPLHAG
jgi:AraC family transcriptional regulator